MTQYYFRIYKRNNEFKVEKDQSHYMSFENFFLKNINEKFFPKNIHS